MTNAELVAELQDRTDLTTIEHELLDRLIRALDVIDELEEQVPSCHPTGQQQEVAVAAEVPA